MSSSTRCLDRTFRDLLHGEPEDGVQRVAHVDEPLERHGQRLRDGERVEQARVLERAPQAEACPLGGAEVGDVAPGQLDATPGGGEEARDEVEEGGLAGAVGADEATISPGANSRLTSSTAAMPPKNTVSSLTESAGPAGVADPFGAGAESARIGFAGMASATGSAAVASPVAVGGVPVAVAEVASRRRQVDRPHQVGPVEEVGGGPASSAPRPSP